MSTGQREDPYAERVAELWAMPTERWPVALQRAMADAFRRLGKCGEVAHETIRGYVIEEGRRR